jgi:hypothetical protein
MVSQDGSTVEEKTHGVAPICLYVSAVRDVESTTVAGDQEEAYPYCDSYMA